MTEATKLAGLDDPGVDFPTRLVDDFLDAPRMDASVRDELLEREARDLAIAHAEAINELVTGHGDAPPLLTLDWRERDGPAVTPPTRRGFGRKGG